MLFKSLLGFTLLGASVATSVSTLASRDAISLNPPLSLVQAHQSSRRSLELDGRSAAPVVRMTNAERMVAGLPPLPPRRRASRTSHAARAAASPGAGSTTHGYVAVKKTGTSTLLGYISAAYNVFGEFQLSGLMNPHSPSAIDFDPYWTPYTDALKVTLPGSLSDAMGPVNLGQETPTNPAYAYVGGIVGFASTNSNLGSGNYLYLGGVVESAPYATPQSESNSFSSATGIVKDTESAIWYYDPATSRLDLTWVNTDNSMPGTYVGHYKPDDCFIVSADKAAFEANFGADTIDWVDLYYVSVTTTPPA